MQIKQMTPGQRWANAIGRMLVTLAGAFVGLLLFADGDSLLYALGAVIFLAYGVLLIFLSHSGTTRNGR
jgi:VIT1/CCC1 family predicted Fe2+/Mn2+ transporter